MADLQNTPLWREVQRIINEGPKDVHHRWECFVNANGKAYKCLYVNTHSVMNNYLENFSDRITVTASIGEGTWQHDVVPYKDNLEITLIKKPMSTSPIPTEKTSSAIETYRFRAFLFDTGSQLLQSNLPNSESKETLDRIKIHTFEAQLINKTVEKIRLKQVGGIYRDVKGIALVRQLLTQHSQGVSDDNSNAINGVTSHAKASEILKRQIVIPDGTPLIHTSKSAIHLINQQCGGIFMYGFRYYYQKNQWYLFAPYDTTQYDQSNDSLTIINIPNNRLTQIDRTWRKTNTQLIILATSDVKANDMSNERQLNEGNGTRFMDSSKMMEQFADVNIEEGSAEVKGQEVLNEFILEERADSLKNVTGQAKITSGYYLEYAELTRRNGALIQIKWENAKPGMIYPGMPTKFMYLVGDVPFEIYGSVVATQYQDQPMSEGVSDQKFGTNAAITIFTASKIPKNFKSS